MNTRADPDPIYERIVEDLTYEFEGVFSTESNVAPGSTLDRTSSPPPPSLMTSRCSWSGVPKSS